jgi:hypothetical protein
LIVTDEYIALRVYFVSGPDAESLKFAADKGIDLTHTWAADINDNTPSEEICDDTGCNEESVCYGFHLW